MKKLLFIIFTSIVTFSCSSGEKSSTDNRPNIMIIMADDMGYSDPGCFGGEINTPNLDWMAQNGVRMTQMYNAARCCPTRASLLTGHYQHTVGMRFNGRNLSPDAPTIAEILVQNGYHTGMSGKWHLSKTEAVTPKAEQLRWLAHRVDHGPFAPLETYPSNRGFEEHWGVIWGVVDYFDPFSLVHNEEPIKEVPDDFYMTNFITEKALELIDQFSGDDRPYFLYVAYTAPHWPLHALPEDIEKYQNTYTGGWEKLRADRYRRQLEMGLVNEEEYPLPPNSSGKSWEACEQKEKESNHMTVHAAMVDRLDQGVGRILGKLEEKGELDNTVIFFLSDNGASPERGYPPGFDRPGFTRDSIMIDYDPEQPGSELTWGYVGSAWASAANTPWRYWKKESYEGGAHTPCIVFWPSELKGQENTMNDGFGHVMDLLPTCLDLAGVEYTETFNGKPTSPIAGKSLIPLIKKEISATHDTLFWEHEGGRAIRIRDWKLVALEDEPWQLFDLSVDRTEMNDLAESHSEKTEEMIALWKAWAVKMGIIEN